ncbi:isoprenyl transferase [Candidatus Saganbacteria bacterium]|nr:isoprenyl transferase [Candidatus Saganbacteria bacterium]
MVLRKGPQHIAIIMDGNGRWAQAKGLPRIAGHREGANSLREVLKVCAEIGVKYLTVYAFSTENWLRPQEEVDFLMDLLAQSIEDEMPELMHNQVKLNFLGRLSSFSSELQQRMKQAMEKTKMNNRITLNVMVNYGGRAELVDAFRSILADTPHLNAGNIDEPTISNYLYTKGLPDPDLLIRTANEMRVSNFLLWQIAYAEIYVTPTFWPDFRREQLLAAVEDYKKRTRKYGMTKEQVNAG